MTKSDLTKEVARKLNISVSEASSIVGTIINLMIVALAKGEGVEIRGFGSFSVKKYESYKGRNPKTGKEITVAAKKGLVFKVGKELRALVDSGKG